MGDSLGSKMPLCKHQELSSHPQYPDQKAGMMSVIPLLAEESLGLVGSASIAKTMNKFHGKAMSQK